MSRHVSAKRQKAVQLCLESLIFYARLCDPLYIASKVHHFIAEKLQAVAAGEIKRLILTVCPRHGKSRLTAVELPTWLLGRKPSSQIVVASYSSDLSSLHSKQARARLEEPFYRELFPETQIAFDDRAAQFWSTSSGGSFKAVGVGGSLTGHGADLLIVDDPFKDFAEASSPTIRNNVWDWFLSTAYTRLSPDGAIVVITTRWHVDDLVGRLLDPKRTEELVESGLSDEEKWEVVCLPALAKADDPIGRTPGEALFPERYDTKRLKAIRAVVGGHMWSALYEGNPIRRGGNYLNTDKLQIIPPDQVPTGLRWHRFWDLATSSKTTADFTAGIAGAKDDDGNFYLRNLVCGQWEWPRARSIICEIGNSERILVGVEAVGGFKTGYANLRETMDQNVMMRELGADKDKLTRALPWIALVEQGKVFLVRGEWNVPFIQEAAAFPDSKHDDMIDAVSGVYSMLNSVFPVYVV